MSQSIYSPARKVPINRSVFNLDAKFEFKVGKTYFIRFKGTNAVFTKLKFESKNEKYLIFSDFQNQKYYIFTNEACNLEIRKPNSYGVY